MKNYDRYQKVTSNDYEKKGIMYYLCRVPSDRKIMPLLKNINNKKILDVGIGTGYYSKVLLNDNSLEGVDQNPHLCDIAVKVYKGDASQLSALVGDKKYDIVFSTWMTEYLDNKELGGFFTESKKILNKNGMLMATVISPFGMGFLYITAAKLLKGINKFNYSRKDTEKELNKAGFNDINIINLCSWCGIPWAYMVIAKI